MKPNRVKTGHNKIGFLFLSLVVFVAACTTETTQRDASVSVAETVDVFERTCLASFPNFSNFSALAQSAGFKPFSAGSRLKEAYQVPGKRLVVGLTEAPSGVACFLSSDSEEDPQTLGQAMLNATKRKTRTTTKKAFPTSFFEYAVQLSNGSLLVHDLREKRSADRNIFSFTGPVTEQQARVLIYN